MIWKLVGPRVLVGVGLVLVVGLISYTMIQYGVSMERERQAQENLQNNVDTRERIDNAIRNSPSDADAALRLLRERQGIK